MARRRVPRSASFSATVEELALPTEGAGQAEPVVNRARWSEFTDGSGVVWRRRGDVVSEKRLRKLMRDPGVRVLHDYLGEIKEVPTDQRDAFWESALEKMRRSPYSDFMAAEFKNESHEHLLVLHEYC